MPVHPSKRKNPPRTSTKTRVVGGNKRLGVLGQGLKAAGGGRRSLKALRSVSKKTKQNLRKANLTPKETLSFARQLKKGGKATVKGKRSGATVHVRGASATAQAAKARKSTKIRKRK